MSFSELADFFLFLKSLIWGSLFQSQRIFLIIYVFFQQLESSEGWSIAWFAFENFHLSLNEFKYHNLQSNVIEKSLRIFLIIHRLENFVLEKVKIFLEFLTVKFNHENFWKLVLELWNKLFIVRKKSIQLAIEFIFTFIFAWAQ